jgi:hypothetical protein
VYIIDHLQCLKICKTTEGISLYMSYAVMRQVPIDMCSEIVVLGNIVYNIIHEQCKKKHILEPFAEHFSTDKFVYLYI